MCYAVVHQYIAFLLLNWSCCWDAAYRGWSGI